VEARQEGSAAKQCWS